MRSAPVLCALLLVSLALPMPAQAANRSPFADAGPDVAVNESPPLPTEALRVTIDARRSWDPDGDQLQYEWSVAGRTEGAPNLNNPQFTQQVAEFDSPRIPGSNPSAYQYTLQLFVREAGGGTTGTPGQATASATHQCKSAVSGLYYPTQMCDTVVVTVRNNDQPPRLPNTPLTLTLNDIDLLDDAGKVIQFNSAGIFDDINTFAVNAILHHPLGHTIVVPLKKLTGCTDCGPAGETSNWQGTLAVNHPDLVSDRSGSGVVYRVELEAIDLSGLKASEPAAEQLNVKVQAANIIEGFASFGENLPAKARPTGCFPGVPRAPAQAVGRSTVLRPEIFFEDVTVDDQTKGVLAGQVPDLLLWKVTYQSCLEDDGHRAVGPEVRLKQPYGLDIDALFDGDQDVMVSFYDRMDNITRIVVPIVKDLQRPVFFVDYPNVTFQGIPFQFKVYVQDRLDTAVRLYIDSLNVTKDGKPVPYENRTTSIQAKYGDGAFSFGLPPLAQIVQYDLDPPVGQTGACELLYDGNGDGLLDTAYDIPHESFIPLLAKKRPTGDVTDYIVDGNRDGKINPGETILTGHAKTVIEMQGAAPCTLLLRPALVEFLKQAPTQVYEFNLTREVLGTGRYAIEVRDLAFNLVAQRYVFRWSGGNVSQDLIGTFLTRKAETDASVKQAIPANGPFLPGDVVEIRAVLRSDVPRGIVPAPAIPLSLKYDESGRRVIPYSSVAGPVPSGTDASHTITGQTFTPGLHHLRLNVTVPTQVNETDWGNNEREAVFEVFLGQVVLGKLTNGKKFYIRADANGQPLRKGGAVEVDPKDGTIIAGKQYDLEFKQDGAGPRWEFTATDKSGEAVALHWDPLARYSLAYNKPCDKLKGAELEINKTAGKEPKCRPITLIDEAKVEAKASPGAGLLALLAVLALALAARRRHARR